MQMENVVFIQLKELSSVTTILMGTIFWYSSIPNLLRLNKTEGKIIL